MGFPKIEGKKATSTVWKKQPRISANKSHAFAIILVFCFDKPAFQNRPRFD